MPQPHDAMLWEPLDDKQVHCHLCGHECRIKPDALGLCRVRRNVDGELKTLNYESIIAANIDPIEKKPLFHVLPGSESLSVAAVGCNFQCDFCQNWQISQSPRDGGALDGQPAPPEDLVAAAVNHNCRSISYTYTEPTIFFELAYDTARLAGEKGLGNCFVSNGYMTPQAVETIAPYLTAINVDLKAFREETYQQVMRASLQPVLDCLRALRAAGVWVEVTTLVVPGMNDSDEELTQIAEFIASLEGDVPWHVSRFRASYQRTDGQTTPLATLERATEIGLSAGLRFIYCGNVAGHASESTFCPSCSEKLIDRQGFMVSRNDLDAGTCPHCRAEVPGVWSL
jgi:pyruvate formate lyase activating enzyme